MPGIGKWPLKGEAQASLEQAVTRYEQEHCSSLVASGTVRWHTAIRQIMRAKMESSAYH
jgi:hypothetical protein